MSIIAVLASLALVVVGDAQDDSRRSDTQSRISLINSLIEARLENYETIRLPLDLRQYVDNRRELRELRRRVVMDTISSEMPRSSDDVAFPSLRFIENAESFASDPAALIADMQSQGRTSTFDRFVERGSPGEIVDGEGQLASEIRTSSEFLYWILQDTETAGTTGLEVLGDRFIDDTDGDGFLEIIDSWKNPIGFQFVMFDEEGNMVLDDDGNPLDLDSGFTSADDPDNLHPTIVSGIPVSNIRIRMFSTAGARPEDVSAAVNNNGLELITN